MDWFRMYGDMPSDPKIGTLSDAEFRTWVELLCAACKAERNGSTGLTAATVNWSLRRNVTETLQKLIEANLVRFNAEAELEISAWNKRQYSSDSSTTRVKKHREKHKNQEVKVEAIDETLQKRSCNALEQNRTEKTNEAFASFWSAYPKKKNKGQAEKAFAKIKPDGDLLQTILRAVEGAASGADWRKDDGQFIPYPATWLLAKGWEDGDGSTAKPVWEQ